MKQMPKFIQVIRDGEEALLEEWLKNQLAADTLRADLLSETNLRRQSQEFLTYFSKALKAAELDSITTPAWDDARAYLKDISRSRAEKGFTPGETATFIFSLKEPVFKLLNAELSKTPRILANEVWLVSSLIDKLGLYSLEIFIQSRQDIIKLQQQELLEISTPVVKVWDGVLALPLIGTLDSARTQIIMETLLENIVKSGSQVAIIDITGVPTVDTLVAQHLIKTVSAARLMGADCIISGIRPQIAQTMVHLGVGFADVTTKATLADAIRHAFRLYGLTVVKGQAK